MALCSCSDVCHTHKFVLSRRSHYDPRIAVHCSAHQAWRSRFACFFFLFSVTVKCCQSEKTQDKGLTRSFVFSKFVMKIFFSKQTLPERKQRKKIRCKITYKKVGFFGWKIYGRKILLSRFICCKKWFILITFVRMTVFLFYLEFIHQKFCSLQIQFKDLFLLANLCSSFGKLRCNRWSKYVELWNAVKADLHHCQRRQILVSVIHMLLSFHLPICFFIFNCGNFTETPQMPELGSQTKPW